MGIRLTDCAQNYLAEVSLSGKARSLDTCLFSESIRRSFVSRSNSGNFPPRLGFPIVGPMG